MLIDPTVARKLRGLRRLNVIVGGVHLVQAVAILALSNSFAIPVTATFQDGPPGTAPGELQDLFDVAFGPAIAAFLLLAMLDHWITAAPRVVNWYEANLLRGRNDARWIEYSVSASLMIVLIAMLTGINNVYALVGLAGANAAMILFGLVMEHVNGERASTWLPFVFGCIAGAVPWIAITIAIVGSEVEYGGVPTFVVAIFVSLFLLFNSFAINMVLQYRKVGRWRDYLYGERVYLLLSLVAKSALAWQVFAGALNS